MKLSTQAVLEKSVWLIQGSSGEGAGVLDSIEEKLESAPQSIAWKYQTMTAKGLFAKRNPLSLLVTDTLLPEHRVVVTTQNWGGNLCCAWLLLASPGVVHGLRRYLENRDSKERFRVDDIMDPLDQVELHCLSTSTYLATKGAIDDLSREREVAAKQTSGFEDLSSPS